MGKNSHAVVSISYSSAACYLVLEFVCLLNVCVFFFKYLKTFNREV